MPRRKAAETMTDKKRKLIVEDMFILHLQGKTWAECWHLTHPGSTAKPDSKRVMAARQVAWYNEKYSNGFEQLVRRLEARERKRNQRRTKRQQQEPELTPEELEEERRLEAELLGDIPEPSPEEVAAFRKRYGTGGSGSF